MKTDWVDVNTRVTEYSKQNGCNLQVALAAVAPKAKIANYYAARAKILKTAKPKPAAKKRKFVSFVPASAAIIKITHPTGCVIECPLNVLNDVLSTIK